MHARFGLVPTAESKILSFKFISRLGVRSLANASRARQFNPLNHPGVGTVSSNKYGSRGQSCVVVRCSARSCVRGRSCVVVRAWSVMRGRVWSCAIGRAVVRGRSFVVVHGRAWSCVVVLPASRPAR